MHILHFSTDDITGGAAKAAFRLHSAIRDAGQESRMIVRRKKSDAAEVTEARLPPPNPWPSRFDRLRQRVPVLRRPALSARYTFNFNLEPQIDAESLFEQGVGRPDIICLHWTDGLLNTGLIKALSSHHRCPVVWVMADQEPVTGGCHYSFGCAGYKYECGRCPQLGSNDKQDHSSLTWQQKKQDLVPMPICFVAPTSWCAARVKESSLFRNHRIESIPYPIDTSVFRPIDPQIARDLLHLPLDKRLIFVGATYLEDRRKGMPELLEALGRLAELIDSGGRIAREDLFFCIAGLNGAHLMANLPFAGKHLGYFNDELTLALAYQAADLFLCPSIEDAGPMMIPESMLCGTPVIAFNAGGAPDLIESMRNGYLAKLADAEDLAWGVYTLLCSNYGPALRAAAHEAAARTHTPSIVVQRYLDLFGALRQESTLVAQDLPESSGHQVIRSSGPT